MSRKRRHPVIRIKPRPAHRLPKGPPQPLSGSGEHQDRRTRRKRGGKAADKSAVEEQQE